MVWVFQTVKSREVVDGCTQRFGHWSVATVLHHFEHFSTPDSTGPLATVTALTGLAALAAKVWLRRARSRQSQENRSGFA